MAKPLGIQNPISPPTTLGLGQYRPNLNFLQPLGHQSLAVLKPALFQSSAHTSTDLSPPPQALISPKLAIQQAPPLDIASTDTVSLDLASSPPSSSEENTSVLPPSVDAVANSVTENSGEYSVNRSANHSFAAPERTDFQPSDFSETTLPTNKISPQEAVSLTPELSDQAAAQSLSQAVTDNSFIQPKLEQTMVESSPVESVSPPPSTPAEPSLPRQETLGDAANPKIPTSHDPTICEPTGNKPSGHQSVDTEPTSHISEDKEVPSPKLSEVRAQAQSSTISAKPEGHGTSDNTQTEQTTPHIRRETEPDASLENPESIATAPLSGERQKQQSHPVTSAVQRRAEVEPSAMPESSVNSEVDSEPAQPLSDQAVVNVEAASIIAETSATELPEFSDNEWESAAEAQNSLSNSILSTSFSLADAKRQTPTAPALTSEAGFEEAQLPSPHLEQAQSDHIQTQRKPSPDNVKIPQRNTLPSDSFQEASHTVHRRPEQGSLRLSRHENASHEDAFSFPSDKSNFPTLPKVLKSISTLNPIQRRSLTEPTQWLGEPNRLQENITQPSQSSENTVLPPLMSPAVEQVLPIQSHSPTLARKENTDQREGAIASLNAYSEDMQDAMEQPFQSIAELASLADATSPSAPPSTPLSTQTTAVPFSDPSSAPTSSITPPALQNWPTAQQTPSRVQSESINLDPFSDLQALQAKPSASQQQESPSSYSSTPSSTPPTPPQTISTQPNELQEPISASQTTSSEAPASKANIDKLASHIYQLVRQRLAITQERQGHFPKRLR